MPTAKPPAAGGAAKDARPEINPLVYGDLVAKELLRAREFGKVWGELVTQSPCPRTLEEAIETKRAEMAALKAGPHAPAGNQMLVSTTSASYAPRADLEAGLGKAYKVLRAGI